MWRLALVVGLVATLSACGRAADSDISCQALSEPENVRQLATFPDPGVAPETVEAAYTSLDELLPPARKAQVRCLVREQNAAALHWSLGLWLRNDWLAAGTALPRAMAADGFIHPDDMSSALLIGYSRHLRGEHFDLKQYAKQTHTYWRKQGVDVDAARAALLSP